MNLRKDFRDIVKASLKDERPPKKWHYISWRTKDGKFLAAAVVAAENRIAAVRLADDLCDISYEEVTPQNVKFVKHSASTRIPPPLTTIWEASTSSKRR